MALNTLKDRIRPAALLLMLVIVGAATYFEFIYYGPPSLYTVVLWVFVVPMLLVATVKGIRSHPLYQPLMYGGMIAIGALQYLDGDWFILAGLFVVAGIAGVAAETRTRMNTTSETG